MRVGTNLGKCEWVWEEILRWLNPTWPNSRCQNSRWLPSSIWVRDEWVKFFLWKWWSQPILASVSEFERNTQDGWIQDGQIQDGRNHHHQVRWEWMSLSQIELVWVRVRVEWDICEWIWVKIFCLNARWQWIQNGRIQDGCNHQVEWEWRIWVS